MSPEDRGLWLRWVIANALGELVGLGAVGVVGWAVFALGGAPTGLAAVLLIALGTAGAVIGAVHGLWLVALTRAGASQP